VEAPIFPGMMRGTVVLDDLVGGRLPTRLRACVRHRFDRPGGARRGGVVELVMAPESAAEIAMQLAELLLPKRCSCQILDETRMYVVFPGVVAIVRRDDPESIAVAQEVGGRFDIPLFRMQFGAMFTDYSGNFTDRPDDQGVSP
jgi:hypothetical protein